MAKLAELYAFTASDQEGNESIVGFAHPQDPRVMVPLVAQSREGMEQFRPFAEKLAEAMKAPVSLVRFTVRENVETIS